MIANDCFSKPKNVFVVLGMARSGTSVISRGLKALGVDLGAHLTQANHFNPTGFWEDNEIVYKINARALDILNHDWESISAIPPDLQLQNSLNAVKNYAIKIVKSRFAATDYWGFKDPNTTKVLIFWQSIFKTLGIQDSYVIALRNPLSVAYSYQKLTGHDVEHGLLLWTLQTLLAIQDTHTRPRLIVSYDLMMQDPGTQLDRMRKGLNLPLLSNAKDRHVYVDSFIDNQLHHYDYKLDDLKNHPKLVFAPICIKMYNLLWQVANDVVQLDDANFAATWQEVQAEFTSLTPLYVYMDTLIQRNNALKKSLRTLYKSRLWKLMSPLRLLDDSLRARRKRLKQKKLLQMYE